MRRILNRVICVENKSYNQMMMKKTLLVGAAALLALPLFAADDAAFRQMQEQIKTLQQQVDILKEGPPRDAEAEGLLGEKFFKAKGLTVGFYGESKYRFKRNGANAFDAHRYVLLPSYEIADWLIFNSEIEIEHGGMDEKSASSRSRFDGELEIEQFYVDILINEYFNIRSLGIDVVPFGRINKYHEPTLFYSTERPELYTQIIPSTWFEPSAGVFGKITDSLDYQLMVSTGIEDRTSSAPGTTGINAGNGIRDARPRMRAADENNLAYSGRLHYNGLPGLDSSASFYITEVEGATGSSCVAGFDVEAIYRVPRTGLELRGDFAYWHFSDHENLMANNNASLTDNVGDEMYGWYVEAAYHLWPEAWKQGRGEHMDLVPFVRYTEITTQSGLTSGTELDNGMTNREYFTAGLAYFLNENFVVKGDYRHNLENDTDDYFQVGVGMFF
jgi:hypothetical protein